MLVEERGCCRLCLFYVRAAFVFWLKFNLLLPPSGSRGLMLGEILGLSAGLTRFELTLFRFLGLRAIFASLLPLVMVNAGLVGVDIGSSIGLGRPDIEAPGVLNGFNFGVFRAAMRGVSTSTS